MSETILENYEKVEKHVRQSTILATILRSIIVIKNDKTKEMQTIDFMLIVDEWSQM